MSKVYLTWQVASIARITWSLPMVNSDQPGSPLISVLFAVAVIIYASANITASISRNNQNQQRITQLKNELTALEQKQQTLQSDLKYQQSDAFIEAEARDKLSMAKPNETVVIFPEQAVLGAQDKPTESATRPSGGSYYQQWVKLFWP